MSQAAKHWVFGLWIVLEQFALKMLDQLSSLIMKAISSGSNAVSAIWCSHGFCVVSHFDGQQRPLRVREQSRHFVPMNARGLHICQNSLFSFTWETK